MAKDQKITVTMMFNGKVSSPRQIHWRDYGGPDNKNWLPGNFYSDFIYGKDEPKLSQDVAAFLTTRTQGPYYVYEEFGMGIERNSKRMEVVLLHPTDRKNFAAEFTAPFWRVAATAPAEQAQLLFANQQKGFVYETPALSALMSELSSLGKTTPYSATELNKAARKLWKKPKAEKPRKPAVIMAPARRALPSGPK